MTMSPLPDGCTCHVIAGLLLGDAGARASFVLSAPAVDLPLRAPLRAARTFGIAAGCSSSARRAKTCCAVITRCGRPRPRKATVQLNSAETRFLNPVSPTTCTTSQSSHAPKPAPWTRPTAASARNREMVAMVPRSRYRNGSRLCVPGHPARDGPRRVPPRLDRDLRHAGQPVEAHQVADDEELGVPGNREVRLDLHPSRPIHLGAGLLGEQTAERRRLHASGPDLGGRLDATQAGAAEFVSRPRSSTWVTVVPT